MGSQDEYELAADRARQEREAEKQKGAQPEKKPDAPKQDKRRSALGKLWDALPSPGDAIRSVGRGIVKGGIEMASSAMEAQHMVFDGGGLAARLAGVPDVKGEAIDKYHAKAEAAVDEYVPASKNMVQVSSKVSRSGSPDSLSQVKRSRFLKAPARSRRSQKAPQQVRLQMQPRSTRTRSD